MKRLLFTFAFMLLMQFCMSQSLNATYQTEWGEMTLTQSGTQVTGTYTHENGKIKGVLNGKTLTGTWTQTGGKHGKFRFEFNDDFSSFTGKWNHNDAQPTRVGWNGKRK